MFLSWCRYNSCCCRDPVIQSDVSKGEKQRNRHQGGCHWATIKPYYVPSRHFVSLFLSCIMQERGGEAAGGQLKPQSLPLSIYIHSGWFSPHSENIGNKCSHYPPDYWEAGTPQPLGWGRWAGGILFTTDKGSRAAPQGGATTPPPMNGSAAETVLPAGPSVGALWVL